jgi:cell volume regulation protein A
MEFANQIILVTAALITFSIFAGVLSSRIGAPLLLVFLAFGMLAGEDGPGGIRFGDFRLLYITGSVGLALILFDGGLRTSRDTFRRALGPASMLATVGVVVTAAITGVAAHFALGFGWLESLLLGTIVGSTDAAAVFFLLHLRGLRLRPRVAGTLEVESGLNDPMAIFLTMALVHVVSVGLPEGGPAHAVWDFFLEFLWQGAGGVLFGLGGGALVLRAVNRLQLSPGLYPIMAGALALVVFAAAQSVHASGFLAIFLVGYTLGNNPHRATSEISRFSDGLAWLSQIILFLMMGLIVTPSALVPILVPGLIIAAVLILVARPVAVFLSLLPFGFKWRETSFISWVGLRGAVPIFLGTIPVLEKVPNAHVIFGVAFIVVLASLIVQGWTISPAAKLSEVELPPRPRPRARVEIDLPAGIGRSVVAYTVDPMSLIARRRITRLPLPDGTEIISLMRDGQVRNSKTAEELKGGDVVMLLTDAENFGLLDMLFGSRTARRAAKQQMGNVDFTLERGANTGSVADLYGFTVDAKEREHTLESLMHLRLGKKIDVGERLHLGEVELVALEVSEGTPHQIGLDLDPPMPETMHERLRRRSAEISRALRELFIADQLPKNH